ncbi:hypothetical protein FEM48_Zijuj01G0325500 [Ziziphus jujuba var. spinosa]|uniref:EGF-like domain-containing protein n=1 Tax=Ziziphus jujuba var. spinosa TaxID=714518 RepID=A0A978W6K2_ZIZJJ|nr:hypothetical protein FEM48_Zijuj01G0325500 [Ziziphus jujuba var. spinosa]
MCSSLEVVESGSCSDLGCAQTPSLYGRLQNITLEAYSFNKHKHTRDFNNCSDAFIVDKNQFNFSRNYVTNFPQEKLPLLLDWAISQEYDTCGKNSRRQGLEDGSGYYCCLCKDGFQGNPYQPNGCKDINECKNPSLNTATKLGTVSICGGVILVLVRLGSKEMEEEVELVAKISYQGSRLPLNQFSFSRDYVTNFPQEKLPLALDWSVSYDHDACGRNNRRHDLEDGSGYYCQCMKGFRGNPYLNDGCQDINECENLSLNNCFEIRYCVNKQGSYTCSCPSWFKGDGTRDGTSCKDQLTGIKIAIAASGDQLDLSGCVRHCGDIDIPYPFGLTEKCCLDHNFLIQCDNSSGHPTPLIGTNNLTVTRISAERSEMSIQFDVTRDCYTKSGDQIPSNKSVATLTPPNTMFTFSHKNMFTVVGCESYSYLSAYDYNNQRYFFILATMCSSLEVVESGSCSDLGCVQRPSFYGRLQNITLEAYSFNKHKYTRDFNNCSYAFIVDKNQFNFSRNYVTNFPQEKLPLVLDWAISQEYDTCGKNSRTQGLDDGSGYYYCLCKDGFQGNPYQPDGCKDINECENPSLNNCSKTQYCINMQGSYTCSCPSWFKGDGRRGGTGCKNQLPGIRAAIGIAIGFITLLISGTWIYLVSKHRRLIKLKEKFFRQNGGIILQQDTNEMAKIFTDVTIVPK